MKKENKNNADAVNGDCDLESDSGKAIFEISKQ